MNNWSSKLKTALSRLRSPVRIRFVVSTHPGRFQKAVHSTNAHQSKLGAVSGNDGGRNDRFLSEVYGKELGDSSNDSGRSAVKSYHVDLVTFFEKVAVKFCSHNDGDAAGRGVQDNELPQFPELKKVLTPEVYWNLLMALHKGNDELFHKHAKEAWRSMMEEMVTIIRDGKPLDDDESASDRLCSSIIDLKVLVDGYLADCKSQKGRDTMSNILMELLNDGGKSINEEESGNTYTKDMMIDLYMYPLVTATIKVQQKRLSEIIGADVRIVVEKQVTIGFPFSDDMRDHTDDDDSSCCDEINRYKAKMEHSDIYQQRPSFISDLCISFYIPSGSSSKPMLCARIPFVIKRPYLDKVTDPQMMKENEAEATLQSAFCLSEFVFVSDGISYFEMIRNQGLVPEIRGITSSSKVIRNSLKTEVSRSDLIVYALSETAKEIRKNMNEFCRNPRHLMESQRRMLSALTNMVRSAPE